MGDRPTLNCERLVIDHFGYWPSFHDAEVLWLRLDRVGPAAEFVVHAFEMTDKVDDRGYFVLAKHCLVHFRCDRVISTALDGFNQQNALYGIELATARLKIKEQDHLKISLDAANGLDGVIECESASIISVSPCTSQGEAVAA